MQVRARFRCAVTVNFYGTVSIVVSHTLPISFSPFLTSIELQEMITSSQLIQQWSNECQITKNINELFITAHPCPDWLTTPFLHVYSTNTDCSTIKFMKLGESQNCFHKHIIVLLCELWWILSSVVYYCDRECYCFICFSVPGYLYDQPCTRCLFSSIIVYMQQSFTNIIVATFTSTLPSKFKLCVLANGVSTICFRDVFPIHYCIYIYTLVTNIPFTRHSKFKLCVADGS